jgi:Putative Flp pilus-assembly TadE/G-like
MQSNTMIGPQIIRSLRRLGDESGQTIVLAAVGMAVIIAFLGLAIDVGQVRLAKRQLQRAADAAALAGAIEVLPCLNVPNCAAMQTAATNAVAENGLTVTKLVTNCGTVTPATTVTLLLNNGPCSIGSTDPNNGKTTYVEAIVSQQQTTKFARLIGINNISLSARAEAQHIGQTNCIYALDPSASGAISTAVLALVSSNCGVVDESNSASALSCLIVGAITAPKVRVTGGSSGLLCLASTNNLTTGVPVPVPADPLAYLTKPTVPACGTSTGSPYHGASSAVNLSLLNTLLSPAVLYADGAYCGGISIGLGANVIFNTAQGSTFVLTSSKGAGGLNISLNLLSSISTSGGGVTFYNYGPAGAINFAVTVPGLLSSVSLAAPTTGPYAGILFFQDSGNTTPANITASISVATPAINGISYFPTATVSYGVAVQLLSNGSCTGLYNPLIAKDISFVANLSVLTSSQFCSDYSALPNGSPLYSTKAVLVQ